jgi:hypothetical protein
LSSVHLKQIVEMQIFFREFKDQLEKYLNIHRILWEKISRIKERKSVRGGDIDKMRLELDGYEKTITLINSRIKQMGTYIHTRAKLAEHLKIEEHLLHLFQYKFEALSNTLEYIKEIWVMTTEYLKSAVQMIVEIRNQTMNAGLTSLRTVTTLGVVAAIISYLSRDTLPKITHAGLLFFVFIFLGTWAIDFIVVIAYKNIRYKLKVPKEIKHFS